MSAPSTVDFDLSGIGVRFRGLSSRLHDRLCSEWRVYRTEVGAGEPLLDLDVRVTDGEWTPEAYDPKGMVSRLDADAAAFAMAEGQAHIDSTGPARVRLLDGTGEREWFTLLNLFRACLAWRLPAVQGAMIHAAGIVVDGRGFALVGAEGAGKSTFARVAEDAGAQVVSDDVVLLDAAGPGVELLGAPLRSTHAVQYRRRRWPLTAVLFPHHGAVPSWQPALALMAHAKLTANLPFVADGVERDPRIGRVVERLIRQVRCAELTFAPDPAFLDTLRALP